MGKYQDILRTISAIFVPVIETDDVYGVYYNYCHLYNTHYYSDNKEGFEELEKLVNEKDKQDLKIEQLFERDWIFEVDCYGEDYLWNVGEEFVIHQKFHDGRVGIWNTKYYDFMYIEQLIRCAKPIEKEEENVG